MKNDDKNAGADALASKDLLGRIGNLRVEDAIVPVKIIAVNKRKKCPKCGGAWGTTITTELAMLGGKRILLKGTTGDGCLNDVRLDPKRCHNCQSPIEENATSCEACGSTDFDT